MRPFRMFFGLAIGLILFLFVARVFFFAFIVAAVMSIIYAIYRRVKDFITYDRNGEYFIPDYRKRQSMNFNNRNDVEPLFYNDYSQSRNPNSNIQFVEIN